MYSAELLDHFQNPRNVGDLADADAVAEIENPVCGDVLRLSLKLDAQQILEARFKAKGCVPAMACGSALTVLIQGKTLAAALRVNREDLIAAVAGVPQASAHAVQLALDTLAAALRKVEKNTETST
jgi:nitrogen fixation protein NifU and related proteins